MENRIFAAYDSEGNYSGFYHTEFFSIENIPTPNIELTSDQWNETFDFRCKVIDGEHTVIPFTTQEMQEEKLTMLRSERDKLLRDSDWTQMVTDVPLSDSKKEEWRIYRQALRDLPETADLDNVIFPQKPLN